MPERVRAEDYFKSESLEQIPYVIPMPVWILLGIALVGLLCVSIYAISKN